MAHRDGYTAFVSSGLGKKLATTLGLPQPVALRRQVPGRPLLDGPLLVGGHGGLPAVATLATMLHEKGPGSRGLISICAAGGQGVVAILEAA